MRDIGNLIWFVSDGVWMGLAWWFVGLLAYISIIGIPWGRACFVIGRFSFFPFGLAAISREDLTHTPDIGTGGFGLLGNVIWFVVAGLWLAIGYLGPALLCFITIIGIPFGIQHLQLAGIALVPIGQTIVDQEVAEAARSRNADSTLKDYRN